VNFSALLVCANVYSHFFSFVTSEISTSFKKRESLELLCCQEKQTKRSWIYFEK